MMREIKFRAWIKRPYNLMVQPEEITSMSLYCGKIIYAESDEHDMDKGTFELMQFTGLTDKNGVDIYEGDICSTDLSRPYNIVVYRNGAFMYQCNDNGEDYFDILVPIAETVDADKYTEVIGNIYENAHLLNETEG